jgi:two-component system LytT family sensor kinase
MLLLALTQPGRDRPVWEPGEPEAAVAGLAAGAILAYLLYRFVRRVPWPRPFRAGPALLHLVVAIGSGFALLGLSIAIEALFTGSVWETRTIRPIAVWERPQAGFLLYAVVAVISAAVERRARAAQLRADAARAQLAALRAQLHPHFLFNALHTVVQLIPMDPDRAAHAAELVASLLRTTLEEERDEVTLRDEWGFVSRYLEVERIRFGERLRVRAEIDPALLDERLPAFALQTLVENAVHHGAAPRVAPTEIVVSAAATDAALTVTVRNDGEPRPPVPAAAGTGTGLTRLRDRLALLYGDAARLTWGPREEGGFEAAIVVPRRRGRP